MPDLLLPEQVDFSPYRMPAEWEPHEATWLAWPHNTQTWPAPGQLEAVRRIFAQMVTALCPHEKVRLLVNDMHAEEEARSALSHIHTGLDHIEFLRIPTNDAWLRDSGPNFLLPEDPILPVLIQDFVFNSWGKKYGPWDNDDQIPTRAAKCLDLSCVQHELVLEGGSIDVNGAGDVLTTKQCLLNLNRNKHLSQQEIEQRLKKFLGVRQVLWLEEGIEGDDTDGHVDDIARFVGSSTVVAALENNTSDANYAALMANFLALEQMENAQGEKLTVVPLHMPSPVQGPFGRSPASYANFYIANSVVLLPVYSCPQDKEAIATLEDCFPSREIIPIECTPLVGGLGAIHCVTQQQPAA